jgi:hypothetical protein
MIQLHLLALLFMAEIRGEYLELLTPMANDVVHQVFREVLVYDIFEKWHVLGRESVFSGYWECIHKCLRGSLRRT